MIWIKYVVLAGELVSQESEASKRSGVSRAYYGAFNHARRWLEAHGTSIDDHRAHGQVWGSFRHADGATLTAEIRWQAIGELGGALRALRNLADYAEVVPGLDRRAVDAVAAAERIIALLDELEFVD
jgi:hypothetical protein